MIVKIPKGHTCGPLHFPMPAQLRFDSLLTSKWEHNHAFGCFASPLTRFPCVSTMRWANRSLRDRSNGSLRDHGHLGIHAHLRITFTDHLGITFIDDGGGEGGG